MVEYFGEHLDGFVFTQNGWAELRFTLREATDCYW
ncbi:5-methyltetrahydropteroyltriglutamate--homocysteine methyltransferase [Escherichia coli]|nr:5-methyltetrahydropteroyltriglutamate--homocysteine methyltransferase [Escherichia coli]